jgi:exopolysaccharide production protein ExoQ
VILRLRSCSSLYTLVTLLLLAARWKYVVRVAARDKLLWILVGITLISVLWSDVSDITPRRSVALIGTTAFTVDLATRYEVIDQQRLLVWTLAIVAVLSLLFALALSSYGVSSDIDAQGWWGFYPHKSQLGNIMTLSMLVFLLRVSTS